MRVFCVCCDAKGVYVEDKVVDNLQFHQDTVASDANSPLHLIREKEIEISGRMLAAKREADEILAEARKRSAATMNSATEDAAALASAHNEEIQSTLQVEIGEVKSHAAQEAEELEAMIAERRAKAVEYVVKSVMGD